VLALYPSWWRGLADRFGEPEGSVRIEGNVICAADEKVIYRANWSTLAGDGEEDDPSLDELDVGDLVSERAHGYVLPAPRGGWMISGVLALDGGGPRFDGGRIVPDGATERFEIAPRRPARTLAFRTDDGDALTLELEVRRGGATLATRELELPRREAGRWHEAAIDLGELRAGDAVALTPRGGAFRHFHAWVR
jgi:hypothetical protein